MTRSEETAEDVGLPEAAPSEEEERDRRVEIGRISALLFTLGSLISIPSSRLIEPPPPAWLYLVTALGLASGLACLVIPWRRLSERWFHLVAGGATAEVAFWIWAADVEGGFYWWYYVFIAIFAGYVFRRRAHVAAHMAWVSAALLAPAVYDSDTARDTIAGAMVAIPSLLVAAAVVTRIREGLETHERRYRLLAVRDPLTGVGNYRAMRQRLGYEIVRHHRHGRRFALLLLDLDGFKAVNETRGHLEGDRVLQEVGRALTATVRRQDTVARQGGDEFSILAPETSEGEAAALAARIAQGIARVDVAGTALTACIGWAVYPEAGESPDALIAHADAAMLEDKREKRLGTREAGDRRPSVDPSAAPLPPD